MTSGRVPKQNADRLTTHSSEVNKELRLPGKVHPPKAPVQWPENVKKWYGLLRRSGQAELFDYSDWALALQAGDCLTYARASIVKSPWAAVQWMRTFDAMYARLGATFIDRRRERLELHRGDVIEEESEAPDTIMAYRERFGE